MRIEAWRVTLVSVLLCFGCSGNKAQPDKDVAPQTRGDVRAELVGAMEWFHPDTVVVAAFSTAAFWEHARAWFPEGQEQRFDAMRGDLAAICKRALGVDLTAARTIVAGFGPQQVAAVLLGPVDIPPGSGPVRELEANFVMVPTGDEGGGAVLFDSRTEAKAAVAARESNSTLRDQHLPLEMLDGIGPTRAVGFIRVTSAIEHEIAALTPPPDHAVVSLGDQVVVTVRGSEESLEGIADLVMRARSFGQNSIALEYERRDQLPAAEAVVAVLGYHFGVAYLDSIQSTRRDGELTYTADVPSGAVGMASPGVLAAIAIPAFLKYIKRSKASEAEHYLQRFAHGAQTAFVTSEEPHPNRTFPGGPAAELVSSIEIPTGGEKIALNPVVSDTTKMQPDELLRALGVSLPEQTYFQYHYRSLGTGDAASVRITATADFEEGGPAHQSFIDVVVDPDSGAVVVSKPSVLNEFE